MHSFPRRYNRAPPISVAPPPRFAAPVSSIGPPLPHGGDPGRRRPQFFLFFPFLPLLSFCSNWLQVSSQIFTMTCTAFSMLCRGTYSYFPWKLWPPAKILGQGS